jgi:hypothetical protein
VTHIAQATRPLSEASPVDGDTARPGGDAEETPPGPTARALAIRTYAPPAVIVVGVAILCMVNHFHGVDWGDDFALYMHQAKALNVGNIGEVIRNNRFTVDNSGWHTFSPYLYPWGWPLLAAPVYAVKGLNFEAVKVLEVVALCGFLFFFYDLVRRRAGAMPALLLTLLFGLSPSYVGGTDTVLSDLPYLCFVGLTLWWLDRCRRSGILNCGRRRLVILALLAVFAFNIRREGFTLLIPLVALQVVDLLRLVHRDRSWRALGGVNWKVVALPYGVFAAAAAIFQIVLPTTFIPHLPGAGFKNVHSNTSFYRNILAENVGLKAAGSPMQLFHSHALAERLLALLVVLAVVGVIGRLITALDEDVMLAAYLVSAAFIVLVSPYQEGRYLFAVAPFLLYFAYQAVPTLARLWPNPGSTLTWAAMGVPLVAVAGLVNINARAMKHSTIYHHQYQFTVNGPNAPLSQSMFAAVEQNTRGDDIILFFRARAMTLFTDRVALQGSNLDQMLPRVDWYVMEKGSTYSQALLTDQEGAARGLTKVWENDDWVIWRVPRQGR